MLSIKHEILEALIRIKKHGNQDGKDNTVYYGICDHAKASLPEGSETAKLCYSYLGVLFSDWPHHSGDEWYPVEGEDEFETAMDSRTLWSNPMRLDLLHFAIDKLTEELDYADA